MTDLDGKVAVVTGGARGIGLASAQCMAEQGASLVIGDIDFEEAGKAAKTLPGRAIAVEHDVCDAEASRQLVKRTTEEFGHVDILLNNAGYNFGATPTVDVTVEQFDRVIDINVRGLFLTTQAFIPALLERDTARIINMSSIVGHKGVPLTLAYSAAKAAVNGMTQSLAAELAEEGITVNSVHPGIVDTSLHAIVVQKWSEIQGKSFDETFEWFKEIIPQKALQTPRDIGEVVAFLASDRTQHITGTGIDVDGGLIMR